MEFKASDKYQTMMRTYAKLEKIALNNGDSISNTDAKDATEDFFNQCYHFKDWLKKDSTISLKDDVETYITSNPALSLCADYCNTLKHGGLDKNPRSGKQIDKLNTHINMDLTPTGWAASSYVRVTIDGQEHNAYQLATDCIKAWGNFLKQNNINLETN